jgi:Amidohydrolase family
VESDSTDAAARTTRVEGWQTSAARPSLPHRNSEGIALLRRCLQHVVEHTRAETRIGHDRASRTYAFRTFLNRGVGLALGKDWELAPLDPMLTIYAAVTRATLDGKRPGGWFPEQKLIVAEAVEAYTMGSAYAEFQDKEKGSITPRQGRRQGPRQLRPFHDRTREDS